MTRVLLACCFVLLVAQPSRALETDFDDLVLGTEYTLGEVINSGDLSLEVVGFPDGTVGTSIDVTNGLEAGGSGLELHIVRSNGLDFQLPGVVPAISFLFAEFSSNSGMVINGAESPLNSTLASLDGDTLGGVDITVTGTPILGGVQGMISLSGPIQSLVVGGLDVYIDNVLVVVPEPASVVLALVGLATGGLLARRKTARRLAAR